MRDDLTYWLIVGFTVAMITWMIGWAVYLFFKHNVRWPFRWTFRGLIAKIRGHI